MKLKSLFLYSYEQLLKNNQKRVGALICIEDEKKQMSWGEVAPLLNWSKETLQECIAQIRQKKSYILSIDWSLSTFLEAIQNLKLLPAVAFGLESAVLTILDPIQNISVPVSALFYGSYQEIIREAQLRHAEGFKSAKLKVSQLTFEEAADVIHKLKDQFRLRIDVNRAWSTSKSLQFFSKFPLDSFDYIEEPFQNPQDLHLFKHPLAIDESFPDDFSLKDLKAIPMLKALIYKPTIQGGLANCQTLYQWTQAHHIRFIISSSFESEIGLMQCAALAQRLSVKSALGLGTYFHIKDLISQNSLQFKFSYLRIETAIEPQMEKISKIF